MAISFCVININKLCVKHLRGLNRIIKKTRCEVITTNAALRGPDVLDNGRDTGIQDVRDRYIFD